jgi:hypothetical protein
MLLREKHGWSLLFMLVREEHEGGWRKIEEKKRKEKKRKKRKNIEFFLNLKIFLEKNKR